MSSLNPQSTTPVNEWPVRFQFPVTWSCLSAPLSKFEERIPARTRVAYDAPELPGYEAPSQERALSVRDDPTPAAGATHWEMVVPKMTRSRPVLAADPAGRADANLLPPPPAPGAKPPVFGYAQQRSLPAGEDASPAPARNGWAVFQERAARMFSAAWRAVPQHIRVYVFSGVLLAFGVWMWNTYAQASAGHWARERTLTSTGVSRQMVVYAPASPVTAERLEFEWTPDSRGVGLVFRASGRDDYYAAKISTIPAPTATALIAERFTVMGGVEGPHTRKVIPLVGSVSTLQVRLEGEGSRFGLFLQGSPVDSWTDNLFRTGRTGFYHEQEGLPSIRSVRLTFPGDSARGYAGTLTALLGELE